MSTAISAPIPKSVRLSSVALLFLTPIAAAGQCPDQPGTTWMYSSSKFVAKSNDNPPVSCAVKTKYSGDTSKWPSFASGERRRSSISALRAAAVYEELDCGTFKLTGKFNNLYYMKPPSFSRVPNSRRQREASFFDYSRMVDSSPSEFYMLTDKKGRNFNLANYETSGSVVGLCSEDGNTSTTVAVFILANDQARIAITQSVRFVRVAMPKPEF
jgi:hypothetical protein